MVKLSELDDVSNYLKCLINHNKGIVRMPSPERWLMKGIGRMPFLGRLGEFVFIKDAVQLALSFKISLEE